MKISVCMIVKDEEKKLPRAINSVVSWVDEVIVVDTGSKDKTKTIAKELGCLVYDFPWQEDFSRARNYSLERAKGDWILVMDADEYFQDTEAQKLRSLVNSTDNEGFLLPLKNLGLSNIDASVTPVLRLFVNKPNYRFQGIVHEQVVVQDRKKISLVEEPVLYHDGYRGSLRRIKAGRNKPLIEKAMSIERFNPYLRYYLALEKLALEEKAEAIALLFQAKSSIPHNQFTFRSALTRTLGGILYEEGYFSLLLNVLAGVDKELPQWVEGPYLLGLAYLGLNKLEKAKECFLQAGKIGRSLPIYSSQESTGSLQCFLQLAKVHELMGESQQAREIYEQLFSRRVVNITLIRKVFKAWYEELGLEGAMTKLEAILPKGRPDSLKAIAKLLLEEGFSFYAIDLLKRSELDGQTGFLLGEGFFSIGELDFAQKCFENIKLGDHYYFLALIYLVPIWSMVRPDLVEEKIREFENEKEFRGLVPVFQYLFLDSPFDTAFTPEISFWINRCQEIFSGEGWKEVRHKLLRLVYKQSTVCLANAYWQKALHLKRDGDRLLEKVRNVVGRGGDPSEA